MNHKVLMEKLNIQPLTDEEKEKKHILKRLVGPISTGNEPTRNDRMYGNKLWEKALNDPLMKEKINNKCLFLELGHPTDRTETDMTKVCACIPELPKIVDGDVMAYVDVMDTPNGRILNTLIDYGFKPGISSRGTGDLVGNEVDPDSFALETWDIVGLPAVEKARLECLEGLDTNYLNMKKALNESLENASDEDKAIMQEALNNLDINISQDDNINNSKQIQDETDKANDDGMEEIIKNLQESVKEKTRLEGEVKSLQEQLAVRDTKVNELNEEIEKYKKTTSRLGSLAIQSRKLSEKVSTLEKDKDSNEKLIEHLKARNESLMSKINSSHTQLDESLSDNQKLQSDLKEQTTALKEALTRLEEDTKIKETASNKKIKSLTEEKEELSQKVIDYRNLLESVVDKYIEKQADFLGVSSNEIKNRLNETYDIDDIDRVGKEVQDYSRRMERLPFRLGSNTKIRISESKQSSIIKTNDDDDVDESVLKAAKLIK